MTNDMKTQLDGLIDAIKDVVETIPTKTSELTNDSGYLTEHQSLAEYAKKSDIEALSDIQYLTANLFDPANITHGSKYIFASGAVEASDKMCRTKALISLDSTKFVDECQSYLCF